MPLIVQTDRLLTQGKVLMYFQVYQKKYDLWMAKINQKSLPKKNIYLLRPLFETECFRKDLIFLNKITLLILMRKGY